MARETRDPTDRLTAYDALRAAPERFTLFAALRTIEKQFASAPRLGESMSVAQDPVRLGQPPYLHFAPSEVSRFTEGGASASPLLEQYTFGLLGPNGPLPLHLTEYCFERLRQHDDPTLNAFLGALQHRLMGLFYRAWARCDPASERDRPGVDQFLKQVAALIGLGLPGMRDRDAVADEAKIHRAGRIAPVARSADGLEATLGDFFRLPVKVASYTPGWLRIPAGSWTRLGGAVANARLGAGATLGALSWQCQHRFEIQIGPLRLDAFESFLPSGECLAQLEALVRLYTNDEWSWQVRLLLPGEEVPRIALGRMGQLGWTSWLGCRDRDSAEVTLQGDARRVTHTHGNSGEERHG
jgi:type VI secretion system protein ImpH